MSTRRLTAGVAFATVAFASVLLGASACRHGEPAGEPKIAPNSPVPQPEPEREEPEAKPELNPAADAGL